MSELRKYVRPINYLSVFYDEELKKYVHYEYKDCCISSMSPVECGDNPNEVIDYARAAGYDSILMYEGNDTYLYTWEEM